MTSRSIARAAAACAVLTVFASVPAHAQLGALRRAAQRAVAGAATNTATQQANPAQPTSATPNARGGTLLELNAEVLDRFQRSLAAEATERAATARQIAALKTPQQHSQCLAQWYQSPSGQAGYARMNAATERNDVAAVTAASNELKADMERACGADPNTERSRLQEEAGKRAEDAGVAAGQFTARQYEVIKERVVPFCRATAQAAGEGDVRLPGSGSNIFYVYTAAEAAALRTRCGELMKALGDNS